LDGTQPRSDCSLVGLLARDPAGFVVEFLASKPGGEDMKLRMGKGFVWALAAGVGLSLIPGTASYGDSNQASALDFTATLTGAQEFPAIDSDATSVASVQFDRGFTRADVRVRLRGAIDVVAAHFHCAPPGVNGPIAFGLLNPGQLTAFESNVRIRITNADFTGEDCTPVIGRPVNNIAALALAMQDGLIYINLHSPTAPLGEIRGQLLAREGGDD
jgi:hypothetical protein